MHLSFVTEVGMDQRGRIEEQESPDPNFTLLRGCEWILALLAWGLAAASAGKATAAWGLAVALASWLVATGLFTRQVLLMRASELHDRASKRLKRVWYPGPRRLDVAAPVLDGVLLLLAFGAMCALAVTATNASERSSFAFLLFLCVAKGFEVVLGSQRASSRERTSHPLPETSPR